MLVNIPIPFDFVHPEREIITIKQIMQTRKAVRPIAFGSSKSSVVTLNGNPGEVINTIFVIAKMETRKEAAAIIAALNKFLEIRFVSFEFIKKTITAMENPPSSALINMV